MQTSIQSNSPKVVFTDQQIIAGIKNNTGIQKRHFQNIFYERYVGYIYKAATQKCRGFAEAEQLAKEVTQETFIRAFRLLVNFNLKVDIPESEHPFLVKAWLGKIANYCFRKVYARDIAINLVERELKEADEVICPLCSEFLIEEKNILFCRKKHYQIKKEGLTVGKPLAEPQYIMDLFLSLNEVVEIEVTSEFRAKLQRAMNTLSDKEKDVLLKYAEEGCLSSKQHLSESSLQELCVFYDTTSDTIKHIKNRALKKIKAICFPPLK